MRNGGLPEETRTVCECCYSSCERCGADYCMDALAYLVTEDGETYCRECIKKDPKLKKVYKERYGVSIK